MKRFGALFFLLTALALRAGPITLPVYLEDNHAGAFYWLAEHLDLDERCTLLHFDAHSDASAIFDSDKIRRQLRAVHSLGERAQLLHRWRSEGAVQCFNWIEPLMPAPIAQVVWIPPNEQSNATALRQLDGHLEAAPRASGSFAARYQVSTLDEVEKNFAVSGPLIASIDLDYFAELPPDEWSQAFERVWKFICERRDLRAVVIAVSRPYLKDDPQAEALVQLALREVASVPTARLENGLTRTVGNDESLRARELRAQGKEVPAFRLTNDSYQPTFHVVVKNHAPSTDGVWRVPLEETVELEVQPSTFAKVEWIRQEPIYPRCNLISTSDDGTLFARGAPPRPRWRDLPASDVLEKRMGVFRIKARIDGRETEAIEVRRFSGHGFRAAVSEQFGLPYLFGSGQLRDGENTGPETGWGADCANFIVYAMRRTGRRVPWSNPKQLRRYLAAGDLNFTTAELERGLIVHFGSHVAAVMEDKPPLGILNDDDLVAHQLEGPPEIVSFGELRRAHSYQSFDLLRVPEQAGETKLLIGGDVMLGRTVGEKIAQGADPFAGARALLQSAPTAMVNLECVISDRGEALPATKFPLRAPLAAAKILSAAGVSSVSVANNHARDFGEDALRDSIANLKAAGLKVIGAPDQQFVIIDDAAVFALDDSGPPLDRIALAEMLREVRSKAQRLIAFVHWGEENSPAVSYRQRELARWLIDHGVDLIAGAHPHCRQPVDSYHGRPIIYSLGNMVFDGASTLPSWNHGALLEVSWSQKKSEIAFRLMPIRLDASGFPQPENYSLGN